jgi:methionyl-tRNA formyltransferase
MSEKKLILLINTQKGLDVLSAVLEQKLMKPSLVFSYRDENSAFHYLDQIKNLCHQNDLIFKESKNSNEINQQITNEYASSETLIIVVGWQYKLPKTLVESYQVMIIHDSLLPKKRGFSPVVTSLILGEKKLGATIFRATEGIDDGDIFHQLAFPISYPITLKEAFQKVGQLYSQLACQSVKAYLNNQLKLRPQKHENATFCLWRNEDDFHIDWTQSSDEIKRFVDALGFPYAGAKTFLEQKELRIIEVEHYPDVNFALRQPGKIFTFTTASKPVIVCGKGLLEIKSANFENMPFQFKQLRSRLK